MNLYFAATTITFIEHLVSVGVKNILFSYAYFNSPTDFKRLSKFSGLNILVDSGAFTAWTKGKVIDIDEYIEYIHKYITPISKHNNVNIINLDVIPAKFGVRPTADDIVYSAEKGFENFMYMKKSGIDTIHTYHQHEDIKYLEQIKKYCPYIGISPANDVSVPSRIKWLRGVFYNLRMDYKTHILGLTSKTMLEQIPCYSADSIEWLTGVMYGNALGVKSKKLKTFITRGDREEAWNHNIRHILEKEKYITKLWKKRGIVWDN